MGRGLVPGEERAWLYPALAMTAALCGTVVAAIPDRSGIGAALTLLPYWMLAAGAIALAATLPIIARWIREGEARPLARARRAVRREWGGIVFGALVMLLAGLNMVAFMWVKPLLGYWQEFSADPLLADLDRLLFAGIDPWRLLDWLNGLPGMGQFYHRGWFALMIVTLLVVIAAPPSRRRSALLVAYFALWSVIGPLVHLALPAAGPIFYDELGLGPRFAALAAPPATVEIADYLWSIHATRGFGPGAGISAMPSLHIATTFWLVMALWLLARRWAWPAALAGLLIFALSISLGWHYAVDGLAGAALAVVAYLAAYAILPDPRRRLSSPDRAAPAA